MPIYYIYTLLALLRNLLESARLGMYGWGRGGGGHTEGKEDAPSKSIEEGEALLGSASLNTQAAAEERDEHPQQGFEEQDPGPHPLEPCEAGGCLFGRFRECRQSLPCQQKCWPLRVAPQGTPFIALVPTEGPSSSARFGGCKMHSTPPLCRQAERKLVMRTWGVRPTGAMRGSTEKQLNLTECIKKLVILHRQPQIMQFTKIDRRNDARALKGWEAHVWFWKVHKVSQIQSAAEIPLTLTAFRA